MAENFVAQSLVQTRAQGDGRRFEMTFADAGGRRQTISLPADVAADLAPVLQALAPSKDGVRPKLTRMPKLTAVGRARHERLVLIRFDDEPPYALDVSEAENLWRGVREEVQQVARLKAPAQQ
jgi:hypothetical protein